MVLAKKRFEIKTLPFGMYRASPTDLPHFDRSRALLRYFLSRLKSRLAIAIASPCAVSSRLDFTSDWTISNYRMICSIF